MTTIRRGKLLQPNETANSNYNNNSHSPIPTTSGNRYITEKLAMYVTLDDLNEKIQPEISNLRSYRHHAVKSKPRIVHENILLQPNETSSGNYNKNSPSSVLSLTAGQYFTNVFAGYGTLGNNFTYSPHLSENESTNNDAITVPKINRTDNSNIVNEHHLASFSGNNSHLQQSNVNQFLEMPIHIDIFKNIRLEIKDDNKIMVSLNCPATTLTVLELKILSSIMRHTQKIVDNLELLPSSILKIDIPLLLQNVIDTYNEFNSGAIPELQQTSLKKQFPNPRLGEKLNSRTDFSKNTLPQTEYSTNISVNSEQIADTRRKTMEATFTLSDLTDSLIYNHLTNKDLAAKRNRASLKTRPVTSLLNKQQTGINPRHNFVSDFENIHSTKQSLYIESLRVLLDNCNQSDMSSSSAEGNSSPSDTDFESECELVVNEKKAKKRPYFMT